MTLIELVVSAAVMVVLILMVAQVLSRAQTAVTVTQSTMRSNNKVAAIRTIVSDDLRRASKLGFMCIDAGGPGGSPRLILTTAGPTPSVTDQIRGNGSMAVIGMCNPATGTTPPYVLYRMGWVLNSAGWNNDGTSWDMGHAQTMLNFNGSTADASGIESFLDVNPKLLNALPASLQVLQERMTPADLTGNTWKILSPRIKNLSITWTDGQTWPNTNNGNKLELKWYGVFWDGANNKYTDVCADPSEPKVPTDPAYGQAWTGWNLASSANKVEYKTNPGNYYRAIWTAADANNWPKAIRIRFSLLDDNVPAEFSGSGNTVDYEIICPIGQ